MAPRLTEPAHRLRVVVIGLFFVALLLGMLLPVYTDEIGWRLQERAGFDGVDKAYSDQCGTNTVAVPPWFMLPVRAYSAFFNGRFADPLFIRLSGVLYAIAWVALLFWLITLLTRQPALRRDLALLAPALLGLGLLPLLLVWSRPEQPILLTLTLALLIALPSTGDRPGWWRPLAIVPLAAIAISYHFKALVLLPVFLVAIWAGGRKASARDRSLLWARAVATIATIALMGTGAHYWLARFACPDDAIIAAQHASSNLGLQLPGDAHGWGDLAARLIGNINLFDYINVTAPGIDPMSQWMVKGLVDRAAQTGWRIALTIAWMLALLLGMTAFAMAAWQTRLRDRRLVMALVLMATALGWSASQAGRNAYEASFELPLLLLAILCALAAAERSAMLRQAVRWLAGALAIAMVVSLVLVTRLYGPSLAAAARHSGYLADQPYSLSVYGFAGARRDILATARQCRIPVDGSAGNLLVDDLTYVALMRSPRPQHYLTVLDEKWRGTITDPIAYLDARHSDGMIVGCHHLTADLRARAKHSGAFCCLAPPAW